MEDNRHERAPASVGQQLVGQLTKRLVESALDGEGRSLVLLRR
ncbi:hypothetical protein ACFVYA_48230 [Amycolatopsis sp. NPDC058278]